METMTPTQFLVGADLQIRSDPPGIVQSRLSDRAVEADDSSLSFCVLFQVRVVHFSLN